jgi:hypothetical protein
VQPGANQREEHTENHKTRRNNVGEQTQVRIAVLREGINPKKQDKRKQPSP